VPSDDVRLVREFVEAFQRDDVDALLATLDPAVELNEWPDGPEARTYRGHDGMREAIASWSESWEWMEISAEDVSAVGEHVVATLHQRFKGKGSELEVEITSTNVFMVRDSKIVRVQFFTDRDAAQVQSENVAKVREYMDAFNRRDLDALVADADPATELHEWPNAPGAETHHGPDGLRRAFQKWFEVWEWMRLDIEEITEAGDRVLLKLHQRAKGKGSEIEVEITSFNVYTFRDGKVARIELFIEREPALEAAGLTSDHQEEKT
jgi:ketosteroid isomerase-like protein